MHKALRLLKEKFINPAQISITFVIFALPL